MRPALTTVLVRPFQRFFQQEAAGGMLLFAAALVALFWANSRWAPSYFALWETRLVVGLGEFVIAKPLLLWINDGLMAVFFFVVGLEIKREVLTGELADPKRAALAVCAAAGGMAVPALIYAGVNRGGAGLPGWGIPMATDIAFAIGVLALLGSRVPVALKVFLTAVAIVDDLGAVLVIALFYTDTVKFGYLGVGAAMLVILMLLNIGGVRRTWPYALLGLVLWVCFLKSGVHATVAGVLLAFTVPARRVIDAPAYYERARVLLDEFAEDLRPGSTEPTADQRDSLYELEESTEQLFTPLIRLEHALHPIVSFGIMPVFALANAGVALGGGTGAGFGDPVTLGVILGLLLGKPVGVLAASWLAVRLRIAALPAGVDWIALSGVAVLCGIGFTMSLFIAGLAFDEAAMLDRAKVGILSGSVLAGVAGAVMLILAARRPAAGTAVAA